LDLDLDVDRLLALYVRKRAARSSPKSSAGGVGEIRLPQEPDIPDELASLFSLTRGVSPEAIRVLELVYLSSGGVAHEDEVVEGIGEGHLVVTRQVARQLGYLEIGRELGISAREARRLHAEARSIVAMNVGRVRGAVRRGMRA